MDITKSIAHLLYYHNCVIIPGFGGFVCSYRQAQIHPVLHTVAPPSKAISFNINLRNNDGLLANQLIKSAGISYQQALQVINSWVASSINLLDSNKELNLHNIGRLVKDVEGGWQFEPSENINYLPSSFGLPTFIAAPVLRGREIESERKIKPARVYTINRLTNLKIAAAVILVAGIGFLSALMFTGQVIPALELNEASAMSALLHLTATPGNVIKPIPPAVTTAPAIVVISKPEETDKDTAQTALITAPAATAPTTESAAKQPAVATAHGYYIVVGVFGSAANVEKAKQHILSTVPASSLYIEKMNGLTRIGYLAGTDETKAKQELVTAKVENNTYWLLQK